MCVQGRERARGRERFLGVTGEWKSRGEGGPIACSLSLSIRERESERERREEREREEGESEREREREKRGRSDSMLTREEERAT